MKVDTVRAFFVHLTAFTIVVGGLLFLYAVRAEASANDLKAIVAGFIGSSITFLFSSEVATRATYAAAASTAAGAASMPTTVVSAGPPQTTTVIPPVVAPVVAPTPVETDGIAVEDHEAG